MLHRGQSAIKKFEDSTEVAGGRFWGTLGTKHPLDVAHRITTIEAQIQGVAGRPLEHEALDEDVVAVQDFTASFAALDASAADQWPTIFA